MHTANIIDKKHVQQYRTRKTLDWAAKIILATYLLCPSNSNAASRANNPECILNNKPIVQELTKKNFSGEFGCKYGSKFLKINNKSDNYIIYNYIYRFLVPTGGAVHGGQRIIFFNSEMKYLGQFYIEMPYNGNKYQIVAPKKDILIINDGNKDVGEILLSSPPHGILYDEELDFFK